MVISFMDLNSHCRLPCLNGWIMERIRNGLEYNGLWRRMPRKQVSSTLSYQLTCCIASYYDVTRTPSILSISGLCCTALWHGTDGVFDLQWQAHCCPSHNECNLLFFLNFTKYTTLGTKDTEFFDSDQILVMTTSNAMTRQIFFDCLRILSTSWADTSSDCIRHRYFLFGLASSGMIGITCTWSFENPGLGDPFSHCKHYQYRYYRYW